MKGLSLSSTSLVTRSAASASVRASRMVGVPITSAARRAATSLATASRVGTSTLPPMWPHFLTEASWSSKCTPAAPASIIDFISSKAFSTPPKPASASATIGAKKSMSFLPSLHWIWSARWKVALMRLTTFGTESTAYSDWSGYISPLLLASPATCQPRQVDGLQAGLDLLHGLVAGQRAERVDEGLGVDQVPQLLGAALGQRVLDLQRAAQAHHVGGAVAALDALPARVLGPVLLEGGSLLFAGQLGSWQDLRWLDVKTETESEISGLKR